MNWRLLTAINAAIAVITVSAVIYSVTRSRTQPSHRERRQSSSQSNSVNNQPQQQAEKVHIDSVEDLANARVDDLGSVSGSELLQLMNRATPEQLAVLAAKFNDAPTDARTFSGMAVFFQDWAELDPNAALTEAFQLKDVAMRKLAATAVVNSVSASAAQQLIAYLTEHPDKDLLPDCKSTFLSPLIAGWSSVDPEAASKFMDELGDTKNDLNSTARQDIAYNWATLDPSAALAWVQKQGDKDYVSRAPLYNNLIRGWCRGNLAEASAYVRQHLDDEDAVPAAASVADAMFTQDPERATDWVGRLPEDNPRNAAESTVANMWSQKDPDAASRWMNTLSEKEQNKVVGTIVSNWADSNWPEASRWIDTLSGDVRDTALLEATNRRDASQSDSLAIALRIGNDETRYNAIENRIRNWTYNDAQAAEAWVKESVLPPDQQSKLLNVISETQKALEGERIITTD